jgi:hypothetical protein
VHLPFIVCPADFEGGEKMNNVAAVWAGFVYASIELRGIVVVDNSVVRRLVRCVFKLLSDHCSYLPSSPWGLDVRSLGGQGASSAFFSSLLCSPFAFYLKL